MNLFLETRRLTQAREDHLTCWIAAALEIDEGFRDAYATCVLGPIATGERPPKIEAISIQVDLAAHRSRPDMTLALDDGREVACEHKLEAAETVLETEDGGMSRQLERYLSVPQIAAVAYFRPTLKPPADAVLVHPRYLRPLTAPHFLWRDLYGPLQAGEHMLTAWLRDGFSKLGFTPPLLHIGELYPSDSEEVRENQRNFGKLWHTTRLHLSNNFKSEIGSRCELYLTPKSPALVESVWLSPLLQGGRLLCTRTRTDDVSSAEVLRRLEAVAPTLPVPAALSQSRLPNGQLAIDLVVALYEVLGNEVSVAAQEARLFAQVVPAIEAIMGTISDTN